MADFKHPASIAAVEWRDVRSAVAKSAPTLARLIDQQSPGKKFVLYKATYPFGKMIARGANVFFPTADGNLDIITSPHVLPGLQNSFNRRLMPTVLMLKNSAEMFAEMSGRVVSGFAMRPGNFLWLWEQFDEKYSEYVSWPWSLSAGARTIYMLPKISESMQHRKLQQDYRININAPQSPRDHWKIFSELANSPEFDEEWSCELLFFTDIWFDTMAKDPSWHDLRAFLFQTAWRDSSYWRHKNSFELIWEKFVVDMIGQNAKPNSYLTCIVKQLVLTGMGIFPALTIADNNISAPINGIQKAYSYSYKMKEYQPLIMHSHNFSLADTLPTYYSLQLPNLQETPVASRNIYSVLSAMPEIMKLLSDFKNQGVAGWAIDGSLLDSFVKNVACDFFHSREESWSDIAAVAALPEADSRMMLSGKIFEKKKFPDSSIILNGCVRFSNKKSS